MDDNTKKELQSAVFERLIEHLRKRQDVQNIDLMNLAGFCRNCLSKWYKEEAKKNAVIANEINPDYNAPKEILHKINNSNKIK